MSEQGHFCSKLIPEMATYKGSENHYVVPPEVIGNLDIVSMAWHEKN